MKIIRPKSSYKRDLKLSFSLWGKNLVMWRCLTRFRLSEHTSRDITVASHALKHAIL